VVTLAFAICWLPIHVLELMKCADSSILYTLIRSYPKVLYTIRALTHALAYFNSCLNPYLYALLNRNFCFDLIDIIPSCLTCSKQSEILRSKNAHPNMNFILSTEMPSEDLFQKRQHHDDDDEEDDDDEIYYNEKAKQTNMSCQIELLGMEYRMD
jgi:hypothetical protein